MDQTPYTPAREGQSGRPSTGAAPVLARLPLVSPGRLTIKQASPAAPKTGYRFDPPQTGRYAGTTADEKRTATSQSLKSELVFAPRSAQKSHPHIFDWARTKEQRARNPQIETRHLPRSNTFLQRRRSSLGSLGPVLRFATIVVLCTAAGTWFQLNVFRKNNTEQEVEPPKTATHESTPAGQAIERPLPMPTAVGPVSAPRESSSGMRVGRVPSGVDYATLRGDILPDPSSTTGAEASTAFTNKQNSALPRVQMAEPAGTVAGTIPSRSVASNRTPEQMPSAPASNNSTEAQASTAPEVASLPGSVKDQRSTQSR